jgi:hypothetical protein
VQKLIASLQRDPAEPIQVEVIKDNEQGVWTDRDALKGPGTRDRGI